MDKTLTEVFGEFTYSQKLTYEDLIDYERGLLEDLDGIFLDSGAVYLDFTPLGDILRLQCSYENHDLELFERVAAKVAAILPPRVRGRLLCLEKNLDSMRVFWLKRGEWRKTDEKISQTPPDDASIEVVAPVENPERPA